MAIILLKEGIGGFDLKSVKDILNLGLIGLGFFLCYWAFRLVSQHLRGTANPPRSPGAIIGFMVFSILVMIGALAWKILDNPSAIGVIFHGQTVEKDPEKKAVPARVDTATAFKDDTWEYTYKKPGEVWGRPKEYDGLKAVIGANVAPEEADQFYGNAMVRLSASPLKEMIAQQRLFVIERHDSRISVELTDSTTNPQIEAGLAAVRENLIATHGFNLSNAADKAELADSVDSVKWRVYLRPAHLLFANRFAITVFDKSLLPGFLAGMSVADLLRYELPVLPSIDQISADKGSILLSGVSMRYDHVRVSGKEETFEVDKLVLLQANKRFFYLVEASYSPQTPDSGDVLKKLIELIGSFQAYKD